MKKHQALTTEERREKMPVCAKFVDEMRAQFPSMKVRYVSENGIEQGARPRILSSVSGPYVLSNGKVIEGINFVSVEPISPVLNRAQGSRA